MDAICCMLQTFIVEKIVNFYRTLFRAIVKGLRGFRRT